VISLIDKTNKDLQKFNWTLNSRARVIGCAPLLCAKYLEYQLLDPDFKDERYNTELGIYREHCGLENVLLSWSGPEYFSFMLKYNSVGIPEEGLAMLRLFPLRDWYTRNEYRQLTNENDDDLKPFVAEFDRLITKAKKTFTKNFSDQQCERLWKEFYYPICQKYRCDGKLQW